MPRRRPLNPRRTPKQSRSRVTVDAIIEATAQLLRDRGPDGATTARIAQRAGTSVGSLYQYFPTREALIAAVATRHLDAVTATLAGALGPDAATAPLHDVVTALVTAAIAAHAADPPLHAALVTELARAGATDFAKETHARLETLVAALLASRADLQLENPALAAFLLVRLVDGLTHAAVLDAPAWLARPAFTAEVVRLVERWLGAQRRPVG
ncbi:MAG: TetR/AcrR family transcriptional regulator [Myxococcaceae bacterium]|nr:TetR/AcrR family transcriptional regulator [Myxococcaceae bacterium]